MMWRQCLLVADSVNRGKVRPSYTRRLCTPIFVLHDQQNFQLFHKASPQHFSAAKPTRGGLATEAQRHRGGNWSHGGTLIPGVCVRVARKGLTRHGVRKSGKQRTYREAFLCFGATEEGAQAYTPVVTGSMRNRVRAQGIEAPRGACDGGSEARRESVGYPHPPGVLQKE